VRESQPDKGEGGGWSPCKKKKIKGQGWGRGLVSAEYKKLSLGFFMVALNFSL